MEPVGTVFLVEDDEPLRYGLCMMFRSVGLRVEPFASADEFLERITDGCIGCVVTGVRMLGASGLDLQRHMADRKLRLPVIVLTALGDVRMAVHAMKAGAFDIVEKPISDRDLLDSVRAALAVSKAGAGREAAANQGRLMKLTERERQVLDLILESEPNKRIAYRLGIKEKTVEFHRANLRAKMEARSTADLIRKVLESDSK